MMSEEQKPNELYAKFKDKNLFTLLLNAGTSVVKKVMSNEKEEKILTVFNAIKGKVDNWTTSQFSNLKLEMRSKVNKQNEDSEGLVDRILDNMFDGFGYQYCN